MTVLRARQDRRPQAATLAIAAVVAAATLVLGCGRGFPGQGEDGGSGGSSDLPTRADGAVDCASIANDRCAAAGCELYEDCYSTCGGEDIGGVVRCGEAGVERAPCRQSECRTCQDYDETSCQTTDGCQVLSCLDCFGNPSFGGCYDTVGGPPPACPQAECEVCSGLDEGSCGTTPGCIAYEGCPTCGDESSFRGCFSEAFPPPPLDCPEPACPGCHGSGDCGPEETCYGPADPAPSGICLNDCAQDTDCAQRTELGEFPVCRPGDRPCGPGGGICTPGCSSDFDCGAASACQADHHCGPAACSEDGDCPALFVCAPQAGGSVCQRQSCSSDAACTRGGVCVNARCQEGLGECLGPVP